MIHTIFPDKSLKKKLETFDFGDVRKKRKIILNWQKAIKDGSVVRTKEEAFQADFLNNFFGEVLDYEYNQGKGILNLVKEKKAETDSTKSDGALGFFEDGNGKGITKVVIELKDAKTDLDKPQNRKNDRRSPVEQAFSYASKSGGQCKWVIVSNFLEIRLYHSSDQAKYEVFKIEDLLNSDELKKFFFLLHKDRLIAENTDSEIDLLYVQRQAHEINIEKEFYNQFKKLRQDLFTHLKQENKEINENILLEKAQKILDRFIFIFFCEDLIPSLLPSDTTDNLIKQYKQERYNINNNFFWTSLKGLFESIDQGNPRADINKFNGGLFAQDTLLDSLVIKDEILYQIILLGPKYDFVSDLNVNILGHIFEQSISDIEELKAQISTPLDHLIEEANTKQKIGKRKKDGIFYTPAYITKYIIEQTVGKWLEDKKQELNFNELPELDYSLLDPEAEIKDLTKTQKTQLLKAQKEHLEFWLAYKEKLSNIKILDPACGSGAFLNQAFDYLYIEHLKIDEIIASLKGGQRGVIENLNKLILQNNLFGVDLNEESVEITKLSLWLKTANKSSELTSLDNNIKCGNSLIDDPSVAGKKAFNWNKQFREVFKKPLAPLTEPEVPPSPLNRGNSLDMPLAPSVKRAGGVPTHFEHGGFLYSPEIKELADKMRKAPTPAEKYLWDNILRSSQLGFKFTRQKPIHNFILDFYCSELLLGIEADGDIHDLQKEQDQLRTEYLESIGIKIIRFKNEQILKQTEEVKTEILNYINQRKQELSRITKTAETPPVKGAGGFDIIIGNPPYVNIANIDNELHRKFLQLNYQTVKNKSDLYSIFVEKAVSLLKQHGVLGFIFSNSWMGTDSFSEFRKFLIHKVQVDSLVELPSGVFEDATVTTIIIFLSNQLAKKEHSVKLCKLSKEKVFLDLPYSLSYKDIQKNDSHTFSFQPRIDFRISTVKLGEIAKFSLGIKTSNDERFILKQKKDNDCYLMLRGRDVGRYTSSEPSEYIWYKPELMMEKVGAGPRKIEYFLKPKILFQEIAQKINATIDKTNILTNDTISIIHEIHSSYSLEFILCLVNSNLLNYWFKTIFPEGLHIKVNQLQQLPIPNIPLCEQKSFTEKADLMLEKNKELQNLKQGFLAELKLEKLIKNLKNFEELSFDEFIAEYTKTKKIKFKDKLDERNFKNDWLALFENDKKEVLQVQEIINQTDEAVDLMIYELYGLTAEEIEIVKGKD